MQTATERRCPVCQEPMPRKSHESESDYRRRKTCGRACGSVLKTRKRRVPVDPRPCSVCGELMLREPHETPSAYRKRQSCARTACRREIRRQGTLKRNETVREAIAAETERQRAQRERQHRLRPIVPIAELDGSTRLRNMTEDQRDAYKRFCGLIGVISDVGVRTSGRLDYMAAVTEALTIIGAGYGRGYNCGEGA